MSRTGLCAPDITPIFVRRDKEWSLLHLSHGLPQYSSTAGSGPSPFWGTHKYETQFPTPLLSHLLLFLFSCCFISLLLWTVLLQYVVQNILSFRCFAEGSLKALLFSFWAQLIVLVLINKLRQVMVLVNLSELCCNCDSLTHLIWICRTNNCPAPLLHKSLKG